MAQLMLDSIAEGVYAVDAAGRATFINPAGSRLLGWSPSEFIGKATHALVHHSHSDGRPYPQEECAMFEALRDRTVRHIENEVFWRKDGLAFPVAYTTTPMVVAGEVIGAVVTFSDITQRVAAEAALSASERRYRTLTRHAPVGIFQTDEHGGCVFVNARWCEITGLRMDEARGDSWVRVIHPEDRGRVLGEWKGAISAKQASSSEHRLLCVKDGGTVAVVRQIVPLLDPAGGLSGFIGTVTDVTAHRLAAVQARTDPLTGLANRRGLFEDITLAHEELVRSGTIYSVVLIDLDNFKSVNDTYGHRIGDGVVSEVARRLAGIARSGETIARLGGDEFVWLLPGADWAGAESAAERAREAIVRECFAHAGEVTISAGITECSDADLGVEAVLEQADEALYRAKEAGRNTVSR